MEVVALVGPSGTGKSHRANIVAQNIGADVIIDDGLIIKDNRIIGGMTAKSRPTRIGAIKAALFMEVGQAEEAKRLLSQLEINRVLILGTSENMVKKIAARLGLEPVIKVLRIEDVASVKEIRKARMMRNQYSKHVIPAPTVEVRKSLPETIIEPLQVFLRRKGKAGAKGWLEQSVVRPTFTYYGKITISQHALVTIASLAAQEIKNVQDVKGVHLQRTKDGINVEIKLVLAIGSRMDMTSRQVQKAVKRMIENMTGLSVDAVNVLIAGVQMKKT